MSEQDESGNGQENTTDESQELPPDVSWAETEIIHKERFPEHPVTKEQ